MRDAIKNRLISQIPEIGGRCYDPHAADKDTAKPYLVIEQGDDSKDSDWTGYRRIITIWPCVGWSRFKKVDQLAGQVINALNNQLLTTESGDVFTCSFLGAGGSDQLDKDWDILMRGLQFAILALQPVNIPETMPDDPWLVALSDWTSTLLGADWTVYRGKWTAGYRMPAVLWRLSNMTVTSLGMAVFEIRKQVTGHIYCRTPNQQIDGVMRIVQELGSAVKIPLNIVERRYLTIGNPSGDYKADAFKAGQITLVLSRFTNKPAVEDYAQQPATEEIIIKGGVT